jgi:hypothetical protein
MVRRVRDNGYELCFYVHSTDRFWPILLKKSVYPNCLIIDW